MTTVFAPHYQVEALALLDKIVVMNSGIIFQEVTPRISSQPGFAFAESERVSVYMAPVLCSIIKI